MSLRVDPELGTIEFVRSTRAKNINVRISQNKLKVSLPYYSTEEDAMRFINSVRDKIVQKQNKVKNKIHRNNLILDEQSHLQTLTFAVEIKAVDRKNIFVALKNGIVSIEFPVGTDCRNEQIQKQFWEGVNYFLKKEAKRVLPGRVKFLADKYGFTYTSLKIQPSKTRWGSCSQGTKINLSFYLMLLPLHLVDYVILHELCHTKEMNHSPAFWHWMDKVTDGQAKKLRAEVKKYSIP